jgi:hypothetical protein
MCLNKWTLCQKWTKSKPYAQTSDNIQNQGGCNSKSPLDFKIEKANLLVLYHIIKSQLGLKKFPQDLELIELQVSGENFEK